MKLNAYFIHPIGGRWQVTLPVFSGAVSIFYRPVK
jgi:hypothetical protein